MKTGDPFFWQFDVKEYEHWTLRIEENQRYLGQALCWLEREGDMQRLSSLTEDERNELWAKVLPDYEKALERLWQPDHINYAWLGNLFKMHQGHGHLHLIPRYSSERTFADAIFKDERWGKNYVPNAIEGRPVEIALKVRDALRAEIRNALTI